MRALEPSDHGRLTVRGFALAYEAFGRRDAPGVLLLPTWQIAPSRHWRMQVPDLARWFRVVTYDPPGIGGAQRTTDPAAFELDRVVDGAVGVLDHLGLERVPVVGLSMGGSFGLWLAARYPERVERLVVINSVEPAWAYGEDAAFFERRERYEGWEKRNANFWREDYRGWLDFFFAQVAHEPHSLKLRDDFTAWALETTPDVLVASVISRRLFPALSLEEVIARVTCPVLLVHATEDRVADVAFSRRLADARPDWDLLLVEGGSHALHGRHPVRTNLELREALRVPAPRRRVIRPAVARTTPRALFVSSPIGLGHVHRDLAIARELRTLRPDLRIDWLAQHPVSRVLEEAGETIHPRSAELASESTHWEHSAGEHRLHCFYAWREMDEILLANFMTFLDAVRETPYDVWIGDEAWEVDHHLHENPELKTAPYVFLTDFLGWLPVSADPRERELTADANLQMLEQVARYRRVRDRALYVGDVEDLVPERFGPGLPEIPAWAREHFTAVGYIPPQVRADGGVPVAHDPLVVGAVGGTAVGEPLLRRLIAAWPLIHAERPDARCEVVAGPRIDPASLPRPPGLELRGYVHELSRRLARADLAIVQGGLSTTMELTAARRPFLYFPLAEHTEQVHHVAHRLDRYGAGRRMDYAATSPEALAEAALAQLGADTSGYLPIAPGAATRAAGLVAELL